MLQLHADTHLDHGLTARQLAHVLLLVGSKGYADAVAAQLDTKGVYIQTLTLPETLGTVPCALFGPIMGDRAIPSAFCRMKNRPGRAYPSRMLLGSADTLKIGAFRLNAYRDVNTLTVIAGPHDGLPFVLFTAFGGPLAPKEPDDPTIKDHEREASIAFWSEHALADLGGAL